MSHADYEILVHLSEAEGGPDADERVGGARSVLPQRLSHAVSRLERLGWLGAGGLRDRPPWMYAVLTATGRAALEAAAPGTSRLVRRFVFGVLDPEDVAHLERLTTLIRRGLDSPA